MTEAGRALGLAPAFRLPLDGARMLARERRLWVFAAVPMLLSLAAFCSALVLVWTFAGEIHGWATAWMPVLEVSRWYAWLWIGPARLILGLLGVALFLAVAAVALVLAYLLASLLASPFHDALAYRVEKIVTGRVEDASGPGVLGLLREGLRAVVEEARRLLFFLSVVVPLALVGLLVPGAQLLSGPAITAFTIFFLPLEYASYTLDRRHTSFPEKRRWALAQKSAMTGFGLAAFCLVSIPGLNFFAMPVLVVAGTLLALRHPPQASLREARGAASGTPTSP